MSRVAFIGYTAGTGKNEYLRDSLKSSLKLFISSEMHFEEVPESEITEIMQAHDMKGIFKFTKIAEQIPSMLHLCRLLRADILIFGSYFDESTPDTARVSTHIFFAGHGFLKTLEDAVFTLDTTMFKAMDTLAGKISAELKSNQSVLPGPAKRRQVLRSGTPVIAQLVSKNHKEKEFNQRIFLPLGKEISTRFQAHLETIEIEKILPFKTKGPWQQNPVQSDILIWYEAESSVCFDYPGAQHGACLKLNETPGELQRAFRFFDAKISGEPVSVDVEVHGLKSNLAFSLNGHGFEVRKDFPRISSLAHFSSGETIKGKIEKQPDFPGQSCTFTETERFASFTPVKFHIYCLSKTQPVLLEVTNWSSEPAAARLSTGEEIIITENRIYRFDTWITEGETYGIFLAPEVKKKCSLDAPKDAMRKAQLLFLLDCRTRPVGLWAVSAGIGKIAAFATRQEVARVDEPFPLSAFPYGILISADYTRPGFFFAALGAGLRFSYHNSATDLPVTMFSGERSAASPFQLSQYSLVAYVDYGLPFSEKIEVRPLFGGGIHWLSVRRPAVSTVQTELLPGIHTGFIVAYSLNREWKIRAAINLDILFFSIMSAQFSINYVAGVEYAINR